MPHNPNPERPKSTYASFTNNTNRSISIVCSSSKINGHHLLAWRAPTRHGNGLETACFEQSNKRDTRTLKLKGLGIPWKHRKLILKYTRKYRLRLWRPPAEPLKSAYLSDFNFS